VRKSESRCSGARHFSRLRQTDDDFLAGYRIKDCDCHHSLPRSLRGLARLEVVAIPRLTFPVYESAP
jgi:hypothetical protein